MFAPYFVRVVLAPFWLHGSDDGERSDAGEDIEENISGLQEVNDPLVFSHQTRIPVDLRKVEFKFGAIFSDGNDKVTFGRRVLWGVPVAAAVAVGVDSGVRSRCEHLHLEVPEGVVDVGGLVDDQLDVRQPQQDLPDHGFKRKEFFFEVDVNDVADVRVGA